MISSSIIRNILERLAKMFSANEYQSRLEAYLKTKSITDAAILENYIKEFEYKSYKEF